MARTKVLRLTPELAARVPPGPGGDPFSVLPEGRRRATEDELAALAAGLFASAPDPEAVWVFAYGSLIWKPAFEHVEHRVGRARGFRRRFCLGWDRAFRGCAERPGLMLALDRGGQCEGVAYRLPPQAALDNLHSLVKREMLLLPHPFPPRWLRIETAGGPLRALAFVMDRKSSAYVEGLAEHEIADVLASAAGPAGTMAEYLQSTVAHLREHGVHDRTLWRLQEMVAERLERLPISASPS